MLSWTSFSVTTSEKLFQEESCVSPCRRRCFKTTHSGKLRKTWSKGRAPPCLGAFGVQNVPHAGMRLGQADERLELAWRGRDGLALVAALPHGDISAEQRARACMSRTQGQPRTGDMAVLLLPYPLISARDASSVMAGWMCFRAKEM